MPGKRTNDSVDKILEELNRQQLDQGLRTSLNDQQVDDILRSVGIPVDNPGTAHTPPSPDVDALLADLIPGAAPRQAAPVQEPPRPAAPPYTPPAPAPQQPVVQPEEEADERPPVDTGTVGDTTSTGIIKNFLLKMAPESANADTDALDQGKNQFKDFFGKSVAVVPDEKGRLREAKPTGNTGEFVPINISLGGGRSGDSTGSEDRPAPKKRGGLFGLFGRRDAGEPEELPPPEPPVQKPAPQPVEEDGKPVYRSKYTASRRSKEPPTEIPRQPAPEPVVQPVQPVQPAPRVQTPPPAPVSGETLSGETLAMLRATVNNSRPAADHTGTIYRKKRDTVEFIPRKKSPTAPRPVVSDPTGVVSLGSAAPAPRTGAVSLDRAAQPAPTPVNTYTSTGFTVQMDGIGGNPLDSTQDFLAAFDQVRPRPQPAPQAAPPADLPDTLPESPEERNRLLDTLTGQIRLDLNAPAAPEKPKPAASDFVNNIADSINAQPTAQIPDLSQYDAAAARLTGVQPMPGQELSEREKTAVRLKKVAEKVRLSGTPEDEKAPSPDGAFTEELPRLRGTPRYNSVEDAPAVRRALDAQVMTQFVLTALTGLLSLVMLYLGIAASNGTLPIPGPLDPLTGATPLLGVMLGMLAACGALSWRTLLNGLRGLAGQPTADSMPTLAFLAAVMQLVVFLISPEEYTPATLHLVAGPAGLLLCLNLLGKATDALTQRDGFRLVSSKVDHSVAYRLKDASTLHAVTRGLAEPRPSVLVSRPTQLFKGFLNAGAARRTSDKNQQQFAWLLSVCAVLSLVVTLIRQQSAGQAVSAMAAVFVVGTPLAGTLLSALPARLMQRSAAQVGAVIPGWKDIRQLGRINVVQITAKDLFPAGCVSLSGVNPVNTIDQSIVYAASMLAESGSLLREVFLRMLDNNKLLVKVADRQTVYGKGYVGWINGQRVLIGNRALMSDYGIKLPSLDYEQRHTVNQRRVVYLAVSGKLFSMFQMSYQRDPDTAAVLDSLRRSGLSLIVDCDDFNVDEALLEAAYSLPAGAVKVLTGAEREVMAPATAWLPESEGNMLHLGSFISFVGGLEAAAGAAEGERKAAMVMCASVLLSCLLSLIMVFSAGLAKLALPYIVLYQVAWAVLSLLFPLLQRY